MAINYSENSIFYDCEPNKITNEYNESTSATMKNGEATEPRKVEPMFQWFDVEYFSQLRKRTKIGKQRIDNYRNERAVEYFKGLEYLQLLLQKVYTNALNHKNLKDLLKNMIDISCRIEKTIIRLIKRFQERMSINYRSIGEKEVCKMFQKFEKSLKNQDNDNVLLIGSIESEKSTIRLFTGTKRDLQSRTICESIDDPHSTDIVTTAFIRQEMGYVIPVMMHFDDALLSDNETKDNVFCVTSGFDDRAISKIDIVNFLNIIKASNSCNSVRILALLSYRNSEEKNDIQKLTHLLINLINHAVLHLNAVTYEFTKYSPTLEIPFILLNIKNSKPQNYYYLFCYTIVIIMHLLQYMIDTARDRTNIIRAVSNFEKALTQQLVFLDFTKNPNDIFCSSISQRTQRIIYNLIHEYKLNIILATENKNIDELEFYLNYFNILRNLVKQHSIEESYKELIADVNNRINEQCGSVIVAFKRKLFIPDGLKANDIQEYMFINRYIQQMQKLRGYLGVDMITSEHFSQNLFYELTHLNFDLHVDDVHMCTSFIRTILDNVQNLKETFKDFEDLYVTLCKTFCQNFEKSTETISELIANNRFADIVKMNNLIWECSLTLNHHFYGKFEGKFQSSIQTLLHYLNDFCSKADNLFSKFRLNEADIEKLQSYIDILKVVKAIPMLDDQIFKYIQIAEKQNKYFTPLEYCPSKIHKNLISKIAKHYNEVAQWFDERCHLNGDNALELVEASFAQIHLVHQLHDAELETSKIFYRAVQKMHCYVENRQYTIEQILMNLDQQIDIVSYRRIRQLLLNLKNVQWIETIFPGKYHSMACHISDELIEHLKKFEKRLMKLDFTLKHPENILLAKDIIERIEEIQILDVYLPGLATYRNKITEYFIQTITDVCNDIKSNFDLKEIMQKKGNKSNCLHPADLYLKQLKYKSINELSDEIATLKLNYVSEFSLLEEEEENDLFRKNQRFVLKMDSSIIKSTFAQNSFSPTIYEMNRYCVQDPSNTNEIHDLDVNLFENSTKILKENHQTFREPIDERKQQYHLRLNELENVRKTYFSLLCNPYGFDIENEGKIYKVAEQNSEHFNQAVYFYEKFDVTKANDALKYLSMCDNLGNIELKALINQTDDSLKNCIQQYGNDLYDKIENNYQHIINSNEDNIECYGKVFENFFLKFYSLEKYEYVFQCLSGNYQISYYCRLFKNFHNLLNNQIQEYSMAREYEKLKRLLALARSFSYLDYLPLLHLSDYGFQCLHRQYFIELFRISEENYKLILDYVAKEDYIYTNILLSYIKKDFIKSKYLNHIKHVLECSIIKLKRTIQSDLIWLEENIRKNENLIRIIGDNLEKVTIILEQEYILHFIDKSVKTGLTTFLFETRQVLTNIFLKETSSIEIFLNLNHFLEAEQAFKHLRFISRYLSEYYQSDLINGGIQKLNDRFKNPLDDILQRFDFNDTDKYLLYPPGEIILQLKRAISAGCEQYRETYRGLLEHIRIKFSNLLDRVKNQSIGNRWDQLQSVRSAFYFLPDEMKMFFKDDFDQLNVSKE